MSLVKGIARAINDMAQNLSIKQKVVLQQIFRTTSIFGLSSALTKIKIEVLFKIHRFGK